MENKSFLTREEAVRLYRVCNEMIIPYSYSDYSSDVFDVWENIVDAFSKLIVGAAHLTDKLGNLKRYNFKDIAKLSHIDDFGEGYVDWYSGYGGANDVLEGCGLMADSLYGAERFAAYVLDDTDVDIFDIAKEVVEMLKPKYGDKPIAYPEDGMLIVRDEQDSDCADDYDGEEYEEEHIEKMTYEFAEALMMIGSDVVFRLSDYQGLKDLYKVVCFIYGLEKDEIESEEFFIEHIKEFLIAIFGSGRVPFRERSGARFCAMVCVNFWKSDRAAETFRRLKDKENLTEEEQAFMWACYSLSGSYYISDVCDLSGVLIAGGHLMFMRVQPQVADSSDDFHPLYDSFAHKFAPLIIDALCDEGGEEKCG